MSWTTYMQKNTLIVQKIYIEKLTKIAKIASCRLPDQLPLEFIECNLQIRILG